MGGVMFDYETGVGFALLLWVWSSFFLLIEINSRMERNLNKVGQRVSWLGLEPKMMTQRDQQRIFVCKVLKYLLIVLVGFVSAWLSWLYVFLSIALIAYRLNKSRGEPQNIREFRWKLKNVDMSFDQIVIGLMSVAEQDPAEFEAVKQHVLDEMKERGLV
jgi:hypothetical protein